MPPSFRHGTWEGPDDARVWRSGRRRCFLFDAGVALADLRPVLARIHGRAVLEIGCGGGAQNLIAAVAGGARRAVGADPSGAQLDEARRLAAEHGAAIELHALDAESAHPAGADRRRQVVAALVRSGVEDLRGHIAHILAGNRTQRCARGRTHRPRPPDTDGLRPPRRTARTPPPRN
jgi:SAM-dependent methyltransferase